MWARRYAGAQAGSRPSVMPTSPPAVRQRSLPYAEVFLLAFAALALEIAYTRIVSYKLFYYHTYLVIGLAMLGMGFGGALVSLRPRIADPDRRLAPIATLGACLTALAYVVVARVEVSVLDFSSSAMAPVLLLLVCAAVFAAFGVVGVLLAGAFANGAERMARLYVADLVGAALGCGIAVPLLSLIGAPATVMVAAAALALAGAVAALRHSAGRAVPALVVTAGLLGLAFTPRLVPDPITDPVKTMHPRHAGGHPALFSAWSPVFRIDVTASWTGDANVLVIHHDGLWGSTLHRWDGTRESLAPFDRNERALPFRTLGRRPERVAIIGAAGGHEILAALRFDSAHVDAIELNPATVSVVRRHFADFVGHVADDPAVTLVNDEGRSWLTSQTGPFDVVYFVAPDSYAAMNSATSGAFVLSESYLYTVEMIEETLSRLAPDGLLAMQFGEDDYERHPNRTLRYLTTARAALARLGVADAGAHVALVTTKSLGDVSTILVARRPIDAARAARFAAAAADVPATTVRWLPGTGGAPGPVASVLTLDQPALAAWLAAFPFDVGPVYDDAPFFWHFGRLSSFLGFGRPEGPGVMWEASGAGERVLMATLVVATLFAALCLALPLALAGATWSSPVPRAVIGLYFATLGIGFMLFEIALVQKLALVVGYPTYSLTVTLFSLLLAAGIGSLASERVEMAPSRLAGRLSVAVVVLALAYGVGLDAVTPTLLTLPLAVRLAAVFAFTVPLGLVLGMFLPLGIRYVTRRSADPAPLVAWAWAANGFCSVIGSVATTILAMSVGFRAVFGVAAVVYLVAARLLVRLAR